LVYEKRKGSKPRMRVRYKRNHPKFIPILCNFDDSDLKHKEGKKKN